MKKNGLTAILTGAGASRPLGFATTQEFFDEQITKVEWSTDLKQLLELIRKTLDVRVLDVEDVLRVLQPAEEFLKSVAGTLVTEYVNQKHDHREDKWASDISQLSSQIRQRCFAVYGNRPKHGDVLKLYQPLLDLLEWHSARIDLFTLNYDLSTDVVLQIAQHGGVRAYDGFNQLSTFDSKPYESDDITLRIFRLHGSMSWIRDSDGEIINQRHSGRTSEFEHLYIPPGFKGNPTSPENCAPVREANEQLRKSLNEANRLLIIGYSFRDPHINTLVDAALNSNNALKITVLDPSEPSSPDSAFQDLKLRHKSRMTHVKEKFGAASAIPLLKKELT